MSGRRPGRGANSARCGGRAPRRISRKTIESRWRSRTNHTGRPEGLHYDRCSADLQVRRVIVRLWPDVQASANAPRAKEGDDAIGFETLTDEIAVEAVEGPIVGDVVAGPQPLCQGGIEEAVGVEVGKDLVDHAAGDVAPDARAFDLLADAQLAALADRCFRPRDRLGEPGVVDGLLLAEPFDRVVDGVDVVLAAGQTLPQLRLGELAPAEQLQRIGVGTAGFAIHRTV